MPLLIVVVIARRSSLVARVNVARRPPALPSALLLPRGYDAPTPRRSAVAWSLGGGGGARLRPAAKQEDERRADGEERECRRWLDGHGGGYAAFRGDARPLGCGSDRQRR